jgi:hypothetical protein
MEQWRLVLAVTLALSLLTYNAGAMENEDRNLHRPAPHTVGDTLETRGARRIPLQRQEICG